MRGLLTPATATAGPLVGFEPSRPYELHPQVAIRPEPFGALAYHYGNRRLTFVRDATLLGLLRGLGGHASVADALDAADVAPERRASFLRALGSLAESEVIRAR